MSTDSDRIDELRAACIARDRARLLGVLGSGHIRSDDATAMLESSMEDVSILRSLLEHGADPNSVRILDLTDRPEVLRLFAEFGYDVKSRGHIVLQDYALAADQETLDWLLDHGVDINQTDTGRIASGEPLYPGGYDYSIKVLNNAAAAGDIELFDHLVARGAEPSQSLAMHYASKCKEPEKAVAMLSHLLDKHGMDIYADTDDLRDFFHDAQDSGTPLCSAVYHQNLDVVKELLRRGADPSKTGASGSAPVSKAIGNVLFDGFLPALRPLLEAGADPTTALISAVNRLNLEIAQTCLTYGADAKKALEYALSSKKTIKRDLAYKPDEMSEEQLRSCEDKLQRTEDLIALLKSRKEK